MNASVLKIIPNKLQQTRMIEVKNFHVWIKETHILNNISVSLLKNQINCIVGPSGSGKSTLIRSINRINDNVEGLRIKGQIKLNGADLYQKKQDLIKLRSEVGMVFQKPCVFPKSIIDNVIFGIRHLQKLSRHQLMQIAEDQLKAVSLWNEVSHRLNDKAQSLSIGQQQRLCIARTLATNPKIILLDEPTSALDPVSTRAIETLMVELKSRYTLVLVTHNILQAQRISDRLIFMCNGEMIEQGDKEQLFNHPKQQQTRNYLKDEYCEC